MNFTPKRASLSKRRPVLLAITAVAGIASTLAAGPVRAQYSVVPVSAVHFPYPIDSPNYDYYYGFDNLTHPGFAESWSLGDGSYYFPGVFSAWTPQGLPGGEPDNQTTAYSYIECSAATPSNGYADAGDVCLGTYYITGPPVAEDGNYPVELSLNVSGSEAATLAVTGCPQSATAGWTTPPAPGPWGGWTFTGADWQQGTGSAWAVPGATTPIVYAYTGPVTVTEALFGVAPNPNQVSGSYTQTVDFTLPAELTFTNYPAPPATPTYSQSSTFQLVSYAYSGGTVTDNYSPQANANSLAQATITGVVSP